MRESRSIQKAKVRDNAVIERDWLMGIIEDCSEGKFEEFDSLKRQYDRHQDRIERLIIEELGLPTRIAARELYKGWLAAQAPKS